MNATSPAVRCTQTASGRPLAGLAACGSGLLLSRMAQLSMSAVAASARSTSVADLDRAVAELQDHAREFARLGPAFKAGLVRSCIPRAVEVARGWSVRGLEAKGLP